MNNFYKLLITFIIIILSINFLLYLYFDNLDVYLILLISLFNILFGLHFVNILQAQTQRYFKQVRRLLFFC